MQIEIKPSVAKGVMEAPPSKSMAHRMLICAGLCDGTSIVEGIAPSQDMYATMDCLKALGARIEYENNTVKIDGIYSNIFNIMDDGVVLPCRECGSTMRFFVPIALLTGIEVALSGSETLLKRPMTVYENICKEQGMGYEITDKYLKVKGKITSGEYEVRGDISSQFISGLLFALPLLSGDSKIKLIPPVESRSYINMTLEALQIFGVKAYFMEDDDNVIFIKGNQKYKPIDCKVEGDYSNAAFFDAFSLIGGDVSLTGLKEDSLQGDKIYKKYFEQLKSENVTLDLSDCPDLGPVCMAMAAANNGAKFIGTRRLRIKESDRCASMAEELKKFGIDSDIEEDSMVIKKGQLKKPVDLIDGHNDHRIVMAMSLLLSVTGGKIDGVEAVNKSLPDFFERIGKLGVLCSVLG